MRVTNQGGSLAGFIIVGVLLALVLVGGLYGLNRYNAQRASEEATSQEEAKQPAMSEDKPEAPVAKEKPADTKADDKPATPAAGTDSKSDTSSAATTANLPATGPADTMFSLVALGLLSFAVAHYARSRHAAKR